MGKYKKRKSKKKNASVPACKETQKGELRYLGRAVKKRQKKQEETPFTIQAKNHLSSARERSFKKNKARGSRP